MGTTAAANSHNAVPDALALLRAEHTRIGSAIQTLEGGSTTGTEMPHAPAIGTGIVAPPTRHRGRPAGSTKNKLKTMAAHAGA